MGMDAARARFPECPACGNGVDENAPEAPHEVVDGEFYHAACLGSMRREQFIEGVRGDLRSLLTKHEKERAAVKERDAYNAIAPVFASERDRLDQLEREVLHTGQQLDMAIGGFADRIYDLVKEKDSE